MKYCTKCEGELIRGLKYCFHCGADVKEGNDENIPKHSEPKENTSDKKQSTKSRLDTRLFEII